MLIRRTTIAVVLLTALTLLLIAGSVAAGPSAQGPNTSGINVAGGPIGDNFPISNLGEDQIDPAVAYNTQREEYLVVWRNDWPGNDDIYGQRVSKHGQLVGPSFAIAFGAGEERSSPDVAYNSRQNEYLVVWEHDDGTRPNIRGRRVSATGQLQGSEITVGTGAALAIRTQPAVDYAYTADQYLVVWERHVSGSVANDIEGQVLSNSGAPVGSNFLIAGGTWSASHERPDLAYNRSRNEFLVVWEQETSSQHDVYGRRVKLAGGPAPLGTSFAITDWANEEIDPAVAAIPRPSGVGKYLVVFRTEACGDSDIQGQRVTGEGALEGSRFTVAGSALCQGSVLDLSRPAIAGDEGAEQYLVAWSQTSALIANVLVRGQVVSIGGTLVGQETGLGGIVADRVAVASGGDGDYLVAFDDHPPLENDRDIYGQLWGSGAGTPTPTVTVPSAPTLTPTPTVTLPSVPTSTRTPTATVLPPTATATAGPPPTLAPTVTPTLPGVACENILPHGDFEAGLLPPWGSFGGTQVTTAHAHGGAHSARLGSADNAWDEVFAGLELPPAATSIILSYWWYAESTDPDPGADVLTVLAGAPGSEVVVEILTNSSPRDAWHQTTFDLGSYAGGSVSVMFHAETNEVNPTGFYVDDVQVQVCGAEAPTPTATATGSPPPTSAPPATPTPSATPGVACENVLPHGDFEAGLLPPWGMAGGTQITTPHAHGGAHSARLGGADNAVDELFTGLDLPPDAASITLSYWWYVESSDPDPDADHLVVVVGDEGHEAVVETLTNSSPRDTWLQSTIDLGSYAGQFVGVTFHAETNEVNPTSFYVDDVQLQVCGAAAPGRRVYLPVISRRNTHTHR